MMKSLLIALLVLLVFVLSGCALNKSELELHGLAILDCAAEKAISNAIPALPSTKTDIQKFGIDAAMSIKACTDAEIIKQLTNSQEAKK